MNARKRSGKRSSLPKECTNKAVASIPGTLVRAAFLVSAIRDPRRHICGVRIEVREGRCTVMGTDGNVLTAASCEAQGSEDFNAFLPRYALHGVRLTGGDLAVEHLGETVRLYAPGETRIVPAEWKELDWRSVVPDAFDNGHVNLQPKVLAKLQRVAEIHGDQAPCLQTNRQRGLAAWCGKDAFVLASGLYQNNVHQPLAMPVPAWARKAAA